MRQIATALLIVLCFVIIYKCTTRCNTESFMCKSREDYSIITLPTYIKDLFYPQPLKRNDFAYNILGDDYSGKIPVIEKQTDDSYFNGVERFYDMNRTNQDLIDSLDKEYNNLVEDERQWRDARIKYSPMSHNPYHGERVKNDKPLLPSEKRIIDNLSTARRREGFGNNRSPQYWDEKSYPIVAVNGVDMTSMFPQEGGTHNDIHKAPNIIKLWGDASEWFDLAFVQNEAEFKSRTETDHQVLH